MSICQRLPLKTKNGRVFTSICLSAVLVFILTLRLPIPQKVINSGSVLSLRITDRHGQLLREISPDGRARRVQLDVIAPAVLDGLVATEDRFFYVHPGINPAALIRSLANNMNGRKIVSGGSTITMQVARTLISGNKRDLIDKLKEMHLALRLEVQLSKREILALWLNRVSFGNRTHGIESASQLYFGKPASDLTAAESAYLVGLPQSPSRYNPFRYPDRARARQWRVLEAMYARGYLNDDQKRHLQSIPVSITHRPPAFVAPHFTEFLVSTLPENHDRPIEIRTTIDIALQMEIQDIITAHINRLRSGGASSAAVIVLENKSGDILAYAGSADFWDSHNGGQNDGVRMLRQPGSTLKPFTYAHALHSRRFTPGSILPDIELQITEAGGAFSPENYDERYHGPVTLRQALANSYNIPAVRVARTFGAPVLLQALRGAGFHSLIQSPDYYGIGLTLGNGEVSLIELARAYAGLALGGSIPTLRSELWRISAAGDTLRTSLKPSVSMNLPKDVAFLISDILSDPIARAQAFGRGGPLELPFPCAVKTGTSKDYRDNWTVGYTPAHTVAVWVGNFNGKPMQWLSGVSGAGPLFKSIFVTLGSGGEFSRPASVVEAKICPASGLKPTSACSGSQAELFLSGTEPSDTCNVHRRFTFDRTTGLLAGKETLFKNRISRTYLVYPPEYHNWMREQGIPLPPTQDVTAVATKHDSVYFTNQLVVRYPESGLTYQIDPVLRHEFQQILLVGAAHENITRISWWVDGEQIPDNYLNAKWVLKPGTHQFELRGISFEGRKYRSQPAVIHVSE